MRRMRGRRRMRRGSWSSESRRFCCSWWIVRVHEAWNETVNGNYVLAAGAEINLEFFVVPGDHSKWTVVRTLQRAL